MRADEFAGVVRQRLQQTRKSTHRTALDSGLPQDAIRSVLKGHAPRIDRVDEICAALDLEFYIGPRRDPDAKAAAPPAVSWPELVRRLEEAAGVAESLEIRGAHLSESSNHDLDLAHSLMRILTVCVKLKPPRAGQP